MPKVSLSVIQCEYYPLLEERLVYDWKKIIQYKRKRQEKKNHHTVTFLKYLWGEEKVFT